MEKRKKSCQIRLELQAIETARVGLREYCEAIGYLRGYKFLDHESIGYFLRDILKEQSVSMKFDRYRKLRNGINYYGEDIDIETVKEAIIEVPKLIKELEKFSKDK